MQTVLVPHSSFHEECSSYQSLLDKEIGPHYKEEKKVACNDTSWEDSCKRTNALKSAPINGVGAPC